jgi:hypothetical protein
VEPFWGVEIELHALVTCHWKTANGQFYGPAALFPRRTTPGTRLGGGGAWGSARMQGSLDSVKERTVVTLPGVELCSYDSAVVQCVTLSLLFASCLLITTFNTTATGVLISP